jgi:hypothetical protein
MEQEPKRGRRRDLIRLGMDLTLLANDIAELAEREVAPYSGPPAAAQVAGLIEARAGRRERLGLELGDPGWTLLLELLLARLEGRAWRWEERAGDGQLGRLCAAGLAEVRGEGAALSEFGVRAVEHQLRAEALALLRLD